MAHKQELTRLFGCHVSSSGGLENAIKNANLLGVNSIQLHPSPPQKWNSKTFPAQAESRFLAEREASAVQKVFFHGIYLINLANPDPRAISLARASLSNYLDLVSRINGDGVIFHVGSMKDEPDEKIGYERAATSINWILENTPGTSRLLLEVAAGSGKIIGDRVEELAEIYSHVENKDRVGFALDSQHMWASGYDLINDLDNVVANVDQALGLTKVWAIHLNDSKTDLGSRKDRHENLGDGLIGQKALSAFVNHPKLKHIPFILETPNLKSIETARGEVERLRSMIT